MDPPSTNTALEFRIGNHIIQAKSAHRVDRRQSVYRIELKQSYSILPLIRHLPIIYPWAKKRWPHWFLPSIVYLKQRKDRLEKEFETEKLAYHVLEPIQGIYIPEYFGEATYCGSPALVLSEVLGHRLFDLPTRPEEDEELRVKLEETFRAFTKYGVTYEDPKLPHLLEVQQRVMVVDLEEVRFDPIPEEWESSENCANINAIMDDIRFKRNPQPPPLSSYFPPGQYEVYLREQQKITSQTDGPNEAVFAYVGCSYSV